MVTQPLIILFMGRRWNFSEIRGGLAKNVREQNIKVYQHRSGSLKSTAAKPKAFLWEIRCLRCRDSHLCETHYSVYDVMWKRKFDNYLDQKAIICECEQSKQSNVTRVKVATTSDAGRP